MIKCLVMFFHEPSFIAVRICSKCRSCGSFSLVWCIICCYTTSAQWSAVGGILCSVSLCVHMWSYSRSLWAELWCLSGGKTGDYQNCSVLYCVWKLCTVISTLRWAVLTVLWIGFCHTGPILLCVCLCLSVCILCFILHYCECSGVDLMGLKPNP